MFFTPFSNYLNKIYKQTFKRDFNLKVRKEYSQACLGGHEGTLKRAIGGKYFIDLYIMYFFTFSTYLEDLSFL